MNTHDEKIEKLESTVSEQRKKIKEMTEKQVELQRALEDQKVDLTACFENKMVIDSTLNEIKQALSDGVIKQVVIFISSSFLIYNVFLIYFHTIFIWLTSIFFVIGVIYLHTKLQ